MEKLPDLCIYATGSYARLEASEYSDIDLFFVHPGTHKSPSVSRLDELGLFAGVIKIGQELGFPTFSNDGEFLRIIYKQDVLDHLGGPRDDSENYFTARMLLLLESACLVNQEGYSQLLREVVEAYFRDYPDHAADFRPVFLINDVIRFWKTLCLNYEHRRNRPDEEPEVKRKQQVKNFKLKVSRLLTCFGSVAAVCSAPRPIDQDSILRLTTSTPLDRLLGCAWAVSRLRRTCQRIIDEYEWFMELTGLTADELHSRFDSQEARIELFRRADAFGDLLYEVVAHFAETNEYRRFLLM